MQAWKLIVRVMPGGERYHKEVEITDAWCADRTTAGSRALRVGRGKWVRVGDTGRKSMGSGSQMVRLHEDLPRIIVAVTRKCESMAAPAALQAQSSTDRNDSIPCLLNWFRLKLFGCIVICLEVPTCHSSGCTTGLQFSDNLTKRQ